MDTPVITFNQNSNRLDIAATKSTRLTWLENAITISLYTDARASNEDTDEENKRGYYGDIDLPQGESLGSLLWTLKREKVTQSTVNRARDYCESALKWLVDEQHLQTINVTAQRSELDLCRIDFFIKCQLLTGEWETIQRELTNAV